MPEYPEGIVPDHFVDVGRHSVPAAYISLTPWTGEPIANTFGGKPLVEVDGRPMFAELALQRLAVRGGWSARWVETYGAGSRARLFEDWSDGPLAEQLQVPIADPAIENVIERVAHERGSYSGCWDVLAWSGSRVLFVESKLHHRDRIRPTQVAWLESALAVGVNLDSFVVVEWKREQF